MRGFARGKIRTGGQTPPISGENIEESDRISCRCQSMPRYCFNMLLSSSSLSILQMRLRAFL